MSTRVPPLLRGLIDDAAVFPPGNAPLPHAVAAHRSHRNAWYADMIGPLLVPASSLRELPALLDTDEHVVVGVIGDTGLAALPDALAAVDPRIEVRQVEVAVAKRREDPAPGLEYLLGLLAGWPGVTGYAEVPLSIGLHEALATIASAREGGASIAAKFRTGGLAAELFPTPIELAAVMCACRDLGVPFKLTAGLHNAMRRADPETGFVHHGFLGILAGVLAAANDGDVSEVASLLAATDPAPVVAATRRALDRDRPLWVGYGSCSIEEPLADLAHLRLLHGAAA
ncbi:MAG TPA: hypothetical protein VFR11_14750 [Micromonosporaceae bacterium]|nr:hypothetical protein [Micromonosporaceae bacterium]